MTKLVNYVEYKHSYAHAIAPKMKALNYTANVLKKPVEYVRKIVTNTLYDSSDVVWTEKEQQFLDEIRACPTSRDIYYRCKNAIEFSKKNVFVHIDDDGELVSKK